MILSVVVYKAEISGGVIPFAMGLLACVAVILMVAGGERRFGRGMDFLARYTMPIFLMHTLFAAPLRSVLLKLGIGSSVIHVVLGLGISFVGPIIAAWIMKKTKWLEFFLYPNKFVKICLKCRNLSGSLLNTVFNSEKFQKEYDEIVELMRKATQ